MEQREKRWNDWRQQIIGLGDQSCRKSYYPELQKRLEELRASEADLRTLFNSVTDAIFIHDDQGHIEDVNKAMLAMYEVTREQALSFTIADYSAPGRQHEKLPGIFGRLGHGASRLLFEWKARRPLTGVEFDVEIALQATHWKNRQMVVSVVRDITERKQAEQRQRELEEQLTQAQKMESVGRLAGGVAHDFNNMLAVILGHTGMALDRIDPAQPLFTDLEQIQKAAERSADLTRQLLAFARKQATSPRLLNLNETIEGMLNMLRRLIGEDIVLTWTPCMDVGRIKMDPSQIDQALANLCVNARDAIGDTGVVTIETGLSDFDKSYCLNHMGVSPGRYVWLSVSDDGCGMDKETLDKAFEPFFTTKEMGKGTGLGLATVYGIVKQNDGFINVTSVPGQGTTFKLYFPESTSSDSLRPEGEIERTGITGTETVLLVEDEAMILEMTRTMLKRLGYKVLTASTPNEAVRLAKEYKEQIDLLTTDVIMPEMNGKELATRLTTLFPNMRILFMSGYTADVIAHHGVLEDGEKFLQKPFSMMTLAIKVREVLDLGKEPRV